MGEAYLFIQLLVYTTLSVIYPSESFIYALLSDNLPAGQPTSARHLSRQLSLTYTQPLTVHLHATPKMCRPTRHAPEVSYIA
jgi:hypothetical protein